MIDQLHRMAELILITEGPLNLNFAKQITAKQKKLKITQQMDDLFGKNIYRLYYDLDTGKQITPTRKDPKLKFDVNVSNTLETEVEARLAAHGFELVDFEQNISKNTKNGQTIKISKVLASLDKGLLSKYTDFLESMTRNVSGKFYAVISRHVHDLAMMSSHDDFSTCEDLSSVTDISQTMFGTGSDDNFAGDGNGERSKMMMKNGDLIFYMVKEGDWNIQQPLARFADGVYCIDSGPIYGKYSPVFKNFIKSWLQHYKLNVRNVEGHVSTQEYFQRPVEDLSEDLIKTLRGGTVNNFSAQEVLRGLIHNKRFDVFERYFQHYQSNTKEAVNNLLQVFTHDISPKVINELPDHLKHIILEEVRKKITEFDKNTLSMFNTLQTILKDPQKLMQKFLPIMDVMNTMDNFNLSNILINRQSFYDMLQEKTYLMTAKAFFPEMANKVEQRLNVMLPYVNGNKTGEFINQVRKGLTVVNHHKATALAEQVRKINTLFNQFR